MKKFLILALCITAFIGCKKETKTAVETKTTTDSIEKTTDSTEVQKSGYAIDDIAFDFSLKGIDDKMYSLAQFDNAKGFIVIFTCNHCPYAKAYEDRIIALDAKYKKLGYPVIAINPNNPEAQPEDSFELMKKRAKEKGFTFPYLFDDGQQVYPEFGATKTPHVFVLKKQNGKNIVKYIGAIDNNYENPKEVTEKYVQAAVDALLANKEITTKETKAIGCSIKTK